VAYEKYFTIYLPDGTDFCSVCIVRYGDHSMTPLRTSLILLLLVLVVMLAAGCAGQVGDGKSVADVTTSVTTTMPVPSGTMDAITKSNEEMVLALKIYRENLTSPCKKIPEDLLKLTDPNYPKTGNTPAETRAFLISTNEMIPAEQAISRLSINNTTGHPVGDQVYLIIKVNSSESTHIVDPAITSLIGRYEESHAITAWVDINNLEKLAGIDGFDKMKVNVPPEHS
jgi:hypothetical protein